MTNSAADKRRGAEANRQKAMQRSQLVVERLAQGASHATLAVELGVSVGSVRTIAQRARQRLGVTPPRQVVRVGQLPAGPMADRRTKRLKDRGSVERAAVEGQEG